MPRIVEESHTADVMYTVEGSTLEEVFEHAALGMFGYIVTDLSAVRPVVGVEIRVNGFDLENLLYRWLEDLLILHDTRGLVFSRFAVKGIYRAGSGGDPAYRLSGFAAGERFDPRKHRPGVVVKAITYSQMVFEKTFEGLWRVSIVLDI